MTNPNKLLPGDMYDKFIENLTDIHEKERESPGETYGMQDLWELQYEEVTFDIANYGIQSGIEFISIITSNMNNEPLYIRKRLIKALGMIGKRRTETIDISIKYVMECLRVNNNGIRYVASESMVEMAKSLSNKVVLIIIDNLNDDDNFVRRGLLEALHDIAKSNPTLIKDSIPHIVNCLNDPDVLTAINAADTLELISRRNPQELESCVQKMRPAIDHPNPNVSDKILRILVRVGLINFKKELKKYELKPDVKQDIIFNINSIEVKLDSNADKKSINEALKSLKRITEIGAGGILAQKLIELLSFLF